MHSVVFFFKRVLSSSMNSLMVRPSLLKRRPESVVTTGVGKLLPLRSVATPSSTCWLRPPGAPSYCCQLSRTATYIQLLFLVLSFCALNISVASTHNDVTKGSDASAWCWMTLHLCSGPVPRELLLVLSKHVKDANKRLLWQQA